MQVYGRFFLLPLNGVCPIIKTLLELASGLLIDLYIVVFV